MASRKRKVCFIITSYIHYSRNAFILSELNKNPNVDLHIILGGSALISKYHSKRANLKQVLKREKFKKLHEVMFNLEGSDLISKAKTCGLGVIEFSSAFALINPDLVIVRGDRFEVLSAAVAASFLHIPIAHIEGGDVSGSIDECVRHAITKMANYHFVTSEKSKDRVLRMGEDKKFVFFLGSPDVEMVQHTICEYKGERNGFDIKNTGSGFQINEKESYLMVIYHPVTSEIEAQGRSTEILLKAIHEIQMPTFWFWPNIDAGSEEISSVLRKFKEKTKKHKIKFMRYIPSNKFLNLLNNAKCLIGNSSANIKESSYLGVPVVNIGSRQNNRARTANIISVSGEDKNEIKEAIKKQLKVGRYGNVCELKYKNASKLIADKIASVEVYTQKAFVD